LTNELLNKGRTALSVGEWEKARDYLQSALSEDQSPEIYEELGWACWWINDASGVFENRTKAFNLYLSKDDKLGAARNACWMGVDYIEFKGEFAVASGWFKRAENLLEGLPASSELCMLKILKARWAFQVDKNSELAFKLLDESLLMSKSLKNIDGEMLAEALKGFILVVEGNITEGMPLLDDATLLAINSDQSDIKFTTITCCYLIDACERIRDYERATQWCDNVKELCKKWRYKAMFANCRMKHAGLLIWKGDWNEAEEELLMAANELQEFRPIQVNACTVRLADLKRRQGKWNETEELLSKVESHPLKQLFSAFLYFDRQEYEKALDIAERYLRRFSLSEKAERTVVLELLIKINIKLGKIEIAQSLFDELKEIVSSVNTLPLKAALLNAEGHLNFVNKNYEQAKNNLEDAIDIYDKIKSSFESARARVLLAEVLVKLNKFAQAEGELDTALNKFKDLGATKDFEKTRFALKNLYKETAGNSDKNKFEFTGRELEVLRLISEGKNNEEIAEKLFLSVRTVEKHLTNIYSKVGVSGKSARAYVASYAIKHNLILN
jgi:LuxR family transcriptional regulator, maltose regulon positive regulatory protein